MPDPPSMTRPYTATELGNTTLHQPRWTWLGQYVFANSSRWPSASAVQSDINLGSAIWQLYLEPADGWRPGWERPATAAVVLGSGLMALMVGLIAASWAQQQHLLGAVLVRAAWLVFGKQRGGTRGEGRQKAGASDHTARRTARRTAHWPPAVPPAVPLTVPQDRNVQLADTTAKLQEEKLRLDALLVRQYNLLAVLGGHRGPAVLLRNGRDGGGGLSSSSPDGSMSSREGLTLGERGVGGADGRQGGGAGPEAAASQITPSETHRNPTASQQTGSSRCGASWRSITTPAPRTWSRSKPSICLGRGLSARCGRTSLSALFLTEPAHNANRTDPNQTQQTLPNLRTK
jgi:hypothetical protein